MLENPAVKIVANKITTSSLVSGSLILVGGIVVWRLWSNQVLIQAKIKELSAELKDVKKLVADPNSTSDGKPEASLSSTFKKLFGL